MASPAELLKHMILQYPSLFKTRIACYSYLFGTNGTGYEWNEGSLTNMFEEESDRSTDHIDLEHGYINGAQGEFEIMLRKYIEKNIDDVVDGALNVEKYSIMNVYPMSWNYAPMCWAADNPTKVEKEWRSAIEGFCHWILSETNGAFQVMAMDGNRNIDLIPEGKLRDNYEIALKVKDMIVLPEERAARNALMDRIRKNMDADNKIVDES